MRILANSLSEDKVSIDT